jgi:hypothetical protein
MSTPSTSVVGLGQWNVIDQLAYRLRFWIPPCMKEYIVQVCIDTWHRLAGLGCLCRRQGTSIPLHLLRYFCKSICTIEYHLQVCIDTIHICVLSLVSHHSHLSIARGFVILYCFVVMLCRMMTRGWKYILPSWRRPTLLTISIHNEARLQ